MAVTNTNSGTLKFTVNVGGKAFSISDGGPYSGQYAHNVEGVVSAGTSKTFSIDVPFLTMQLVGLATDQPTVVKVNSSSTPTETFSLAATAGVVWAIDFATVNPFGHDITALYVNNPGAIDAKFHFASLNA